MTDALVELMKFPLIWLIVFSVPKCQQIDRPSFAWVPLITVSSLASPQYRRHLYEILGVHPL